MKPLTPLRSADAHGGEDVGGTRSPGAKAAFITSKLKL